MALGRKKQRQDSFWIGTQELPRTAEDVNKFETPAF